MIDKLDDELFVCLGGVTLCLIGVLLTGLFMPLHGDSGLLALCFSPLRE